MLTISICVVPANNHKGCAGRESSGVRRKVTGSAALVALVALVAIRGDDELNIFTQWSGIMATLFILRPSRFVILAKAGIQ